MAEDNVAYVTGQTYNVEILAQGTQLEVWVDGSSIFSVNDGTHASGSVALYNWDNAGSYFDDVLVSR